MNWKNLVLLVLAALAIIYGIFLLLPQAQGGEARQQPGNVSIVEFGSAGNYGYATFSYNGSGNVSLIALSQPPKSTIIVLKKDFLETERYSYFMDGLGELAAKGFTIKEVDSIGAPNNSIIIIPSGAMPSDLIPRLDSLEQGNKIIYLGRKDLIFSDNLVLSDWYSNLSESSKSSMIVIEKSLDEFYSERNFSIYNEIERNSWAEENSQSFSYSGQGAKTLFVQLNNSRWLRLLPLADSVELETHPVKIMGNGDIFPWEKATLTVQMNYSSGIAHYTVEKDGTAIGRADLDRVRGDEAFYLPLTFPGPGDYLVRISDDSGTTGAVRVHVKDLNISLSNAYGNSYEFMVLVDSKPVEQSTVSVGLNHSNNTIDNVDVRNGKFSVRALLKPGENVFVISLFGQKHFVPYNNSQESVLQFYAKYLLLGALLVGAFYLIIRLNRKPTYRIMVPESIPSNNPEIRLSANQLISGIEEAENLYGWKGVPLYAREISAGLKKLTGGMEINEGNLEALMKKLQEKGLVRSHLGLYGLSGWGDARHNALRRIVRDKLIQSGVSFSESASHFKCKDFTIVLSPGKAGRDSLVVFESRDEKRSYLSSLPESQRAALEIKIANGVLRMATLDELDELL